MRARMAVCTTASAMAGSSRLCSPLQKPARQPSKPPALNHCNCTENTRISTMANQKLGTAMPIWLMPITAISAGLLWREAA